MSLNDEKKLISVLIADDDSGMRLILRKKIQATDGFFVAGEAVTGEEAMTLYEKLDPQVVFLDVDMPVMNGVACANRIQCRLRTVCGPVRGRRSACGDGVFLQTQGSG